MINLASASSRCKDANRVIVEMTFRFCQLFILAGCYGRVIRTQPLFEEKMDHLELLKNSLETNERLIEKQIAECDQFVNPGAPDDTPLTRQLSSIIEDGAASDQAQVV